jgi:hypothetical protein
MMTFTDAELKVVRKLATEAPLTVLQIKKACPLHSVCNPLPLFRVYKIDDVSFEAQWNEFHVSGPKQVFHFEGVN